MRTEGCVSSCDRYMNLVLADAEDNHSTGLGHTKNRRRYAAINSLQLEVTDEMRGLSVDRFKLGHSKWKVIQLCYFPRCFLQPTSILL